MGAATAELFAEYGVHVAIGYRSRRDDAEQVVWREWPTTDGYLADDRGLVACRVYRTLPARRMWDVIMSSTYDFAEPGFVLIDRVNEVNFRFAKILRFRGTRTHVGIDVFNVLNSDAVLTYNQTFTPGGAWLAPQSVLTPRFMKVSAQIDF